MKFFDDLSNHNLKKIDLNLQIKSNIKYGVHNYCFWTHLECQTIDCKYNIMNLNAFIEHFTREIVFYVAYLSLYDFREMSQRYRKMKIYYNFNNKYYIAICQTTLLGKFFDNLQNQTLNKNNHINFQISE